jgi:hypothetical protein
LWELGLEDASGDALRIRFGDRVDLSKNGSFEIAFKDIA